MKNGLVGLLLPFIIGALIGFYGGVNKWLTFINEHSAPSYADVRGEFGEPDRDIGSGIHIDIYPEKIGHARVGHTGPGPVFYIDYCVKWCKRIYLKEENT
jgi:hypothetical protein